MKTPTNPLQRLARLDTLKAACAGGHLVSEDGLTLGLISDIHAEAGVSPHELAHPNVDVWLAVGDISTFKSRTPPVEWLDAFSKASAHPAPVLFVPGNHDFYGGIVHECIKHWRQEARGTRVSVLCNEEIRLAGVRFLGTPLWTGLDTVPESRRPMIEMDIRRFIVDFRMTREGAGKPWTLDSMIRAHREAYLWLAQHLDVPEEARPEWARENMGERVGKALGFVPSFDPNDLVVVLTHWPPHVRATHPRHHKSPVSVYFNNFHPELTARSHLWAFGHTHDFSDFVADDPEETLEMAQEHLFNQMLTWRSSGEMEGKWRHEAMFDPVEIRKEARRGRVIAHPRGYPKESIPGRGLSYNPLILKLGFDGAVTRMDGR